MEVGERTLVALGFDEVRLALAQRCRTDIGRERARVRPFLHTPADVRAAFSLVEEARVLRAEPLGLPIAGLTDIRIAVERAAKGAMLEPADLMAVCRALFAFERANELLLERREALPLLAELGQKLPVLSRLATRLDHSFESSGEISDRASAELKEARDKARALHRRIRSRLDELLHDEKFSTNLQETYYSVRNDRYVVPVKSSQQKEVAGIVHNASQTGQTLFVEPAEMIELGNALAIAQSLVLEEERRVLLELSALVGREATALTEGIEAAGQLDELEAVAALASDLTATTPIVEPHDGAMLLKGLRHPRLVLKSEKGGPAVVANTVALEEARALVISGPNAGGKTVTLTGVGLCALMVRAGLPISCDEGSRLPLFTQVHSAVGDQQDLEQGLSTFSAHVGALRDIAASARQGALVLIDEIAADTDPKEGAAIATAVLEDLLAKGALVLVTTHLEELKALAHLDPRFVNARVGFDSKKMAPTYRLQMGFSGASSAIDVARRVGLNESICARAAELATNAGGALSKALGAAEDERRKLFEQREAAETDAREAQAAREEAQAQLAALGRKRKEDEVRFREALRGELEFARQQIRALVEKLEGEALKDKALRDKALKAAMAASAELTQRVNEQTVAVRAAQAELKGGGDGNASGPLELKVGGRARHQRLDTEVEILELSGDTATVTAGSVKMRVPVAELGPTRKAAAQASKPPGGARARSLEAAQQVAAKALVPAASALDVRGERTEEAMRRVEQFLDRSVREGEEAVLIIHGHGTGAIKRELREVLQHSPYAKAFRPGEAGEGGDGVTVVQLG